MQFSQLPFEKTGAFSSLFLSYIQNQPTLAEFYAHAPSLEGINQCAATYKTVDRKTLVEVLNKQHTGLPNNEKVLANIAQLASEDTFTVTTGHQLNLFTGPLFFIYKILTTIKMCEQANANLTSKTFVPVYWMATEDHDFAEINHFHLFNKKYEWESTQLGAVGEFALQDLQQLLDELPEDVQALAKHYKEQKDLASATRALVHELFHEYGLIILDANDKQLKKLFTPTCKAELQRGITAQEVEQTNAKLAEKGFKVQVNPREVNLFYLQKQSRERIERTENGFRLVDSDLTWTTEALLEEVDAYPERFSPNVLLRPVYQQQILPNVAYVGGPGELAYWVQLKSLFNSLDVPYPVLLPRNFAMLLNGQVAKKINKLPLAIEDYFLPVDQLKKQLLSKMEAELHLSAVYEKMNALAQESATLLGEIDASLSPFVLGEFKKMEKQLANIEKRGNKALERKNETSIQQMLSVKDKLFPCGGLQERHDNFLNFYVNEKAFIKDLHAILNPLDFSFNVITYDQ